MLSIEDFENYREFFVIYIVVEFYSFECIEVKYNWVYLLFFHYNQEYSYKSIIQSIGFHNHLSIANLVDEDWSRNKYFLRILNAL